jgi:proteasome lid subunit RPN8/RPN11
MDERCIIASSESPDRARELVTMPALLCLRLLRRARRMHRAGLKAFGLLIGEPAAPGYPFAATDVVFFDESRNRRNDPRYRVAFRAQGDYFREFDDAGFVADPAELLAVWRAVEQSGREIVAPFHVHRRQPANFSHIDYRLHNPAFPWHLIVSLNDPVRPALQPFRVCKDPSDFGISEQDARCGSEQAYPGPEVRPLSLAAYGPRDLIRRLSTAVVPPPRTEVIAS